MPSSLRLYDAPVGHTGTHGGSSQCRQDLGKCSVSLCGYRPTSKVCTRLKKVPVGSAPYGRSSYSGPADPEVFHSLQLVTQAWQPTQTFRSMTRASWVISRYPFFLVCPGNLKGQKSPLAPLLQRGEHSGSLLEKRWKHPHPPLKRKHSHSPLCKRGVGGDLFFDPDLDLPAR